MTLSKGHNSTKGDNPDEKKMGQLFFDKESIYEISKPYLKFVTDKTTDRRAESNMPLQLFQSWGHKNELTLFLSAAEPSVSNSAIPELSVKLLLGSYLY